MLRKGTFILMKTKIQDMTSGSPGRLIILFAIPLMLGNICQQLYTMVDTMIVGQVAGVEALAALGAVDFLMWVVTGISTGLTQGFSIQLSQYYGAKDFENLRKSLAHSYRLTAFIAVGVFILSQSFASLVLTGLHTPSNIIGMSLLYLRIIFCGIPATAAYNMFGSALRAMGNSKTPLTAMIIASVLNVSLDILFVAGFGWGVAGAAIATVIAQSFSAVYCFLILRRIDIVHLTRADFMPASGMNARLMKLGIPVVFQNIIIGVGGLVVQYVINGYGFLFVAGFTATNKLYGLLEMAAISYGYAIVTYVGQNLGAGKIDRIRKGVRSSMLLSLLTSLIISAAMFLFGKNILSLFISGEPQQTQQVLAIAFKYLSIMAAMLWVLYFLYVYRSALQGLGDTLMPMVSGMAEFVMRISAALILPHFIGQDGIFFAEIAAWSGATVILCISYYVRMHKYHKKNRHIVPDIRYMCLFFDQSILRIAFRILLALRRISSSVIKPFS